jgi:hypothetical protein
LNKVVEEKSEGSKEQQYDTENNQKQEQQYHLSLSTQAYKLFSGRVVFIAESDWEDRLS